MNRNQVLYKNMVHRVVVGGRCYNMCGQRLQRTTRLGVELVPMGEET
jgi:hypothetical protein